MHLVVLEGDDRLRKISYEVIGAALALGEDVAAVAVGKDATKLAAEASRLGLSQVLTVDGPEVTSYAPRAWVRAVQAAVAATGATLVLLGATSQGKEVAARLAGRLKAGLAADVTAISKDDGSLVYRRPVYAGKAFAEVRLISPVGIATLRPNAFSAAKSAASAASIEVLAVSFEAGDTDGHSTGYEVGTGGQVELTEAEIIVSGGRGLKGPENFHLIEELAKELGAAVGASRAVVDAGWRPHAEQVGQTGKTVSPALYIACGISGAVQHMAGMSSSKLIVAINKDPEAPIFQVADYGVVGDASEVLPAMTEAVRQLRA
ncbi:MAG: electron transfer flavoprotein subunit alpha/FixB family protein [Sulfobacillus sp.]